MKYFNHRGGLPALKHALLAITAACAAVSNAGPNDACIVSAGTPVVNGVVIGDSGWDQATVINLNADGGVDREAQLYLTRDGNNTLYLGLIVDDPVPAVDDTVVIVLSDSDPSSPAGCANDWRLHIKPFDSTNAPPAGGVPAVVNIWRDSCVSAANPTGAWNNSPGPLNPAATHWVMTNTKTTKSGSRWQMEMKLARSTETQTGDPVVLPPTGKFSVYVNVLSTSTITTPATVVQAEWPEGSTVTGPGFLNNLTPVRARWGTASFNARTECKGLSIDWSRVGTTNTNSSEMKIGPNSCPTPPANNGPLNTFFVRPANDMGTPATNVSAKIAIANWGLPSPYTSWGDLPNPSSGLTNTKTINSPASLPADELNLTWSLTPQQICDYNAHKHQCIRVTLDSSDAGVTFTQRVVQRNMDFVTTSSPFSRKAEISVKGYGAAAGSAKPDRDIVIAVTKKVHGYSRDGDFFYARPDEDGSRPLINEPVPARSFPKGLEQTYQWVARGYLLTGNRITIDKSEYEVASGIGAFGYVVAHNGPVSGWTPKLEGPTVKEIGKDGSMYAVQVPVDGIAEVTTTLTPTEKGGGFAIAWWWWVILIVLVVVVVIALGRKTKSPV